MAFKEITGGSNIKSYWPKKAAERKVGDEITGVYRKRMERKNPDGTDSVLYLVETSEGMVGVNASATITRALEQIPYDTTVKLSSTVKLNLRRLVAHTTTSRSTWTTVTKLKKKRTIA